LLSSAGRNAAYSFYVKIVVIQEKKAHVLFPFFLLIVIHDF
jgi:hypothetical protein